MTSSELKVFKDIADELRRIRRNLEKMTDGGKDDRNNSQQGENQD